MAIRELFDIPYDELRHTCISAFVAFHGSIAETAQEFGNSETMIHRHYLQRVSREEAEMFYAIVPKNKVRPPPAAYDLMVAG